jgi:hypothetical protein
MRDESQPRIKRAERRLDIRTPEGAEMLRDRLRSARRPSTAGSVAARDLNLDHLGADQPEKVGAMRALQAHEANG